MPEKVFPDSLTISNAERDEEEVVCGRFSQHYTWEEVHAFLSVFGTPRNLRPRYNIAPTTTIDVIRLSSEGRELVPMRWGLIPVWWKKPVKELPATFNARAETVAEKPMFRGAFKKQRCIIPVSGFYEWTGEKGAKQPYFFSAGDGSPILAFAGLWDSWRDETTGDQILSCTMIVSGANAWMTPYHDRMPVLLAPASFDAWLDGSLGPDALQPAAEEALRAWPVSKRVNSVKDGDDDPSLTEPLMA